jgi:Holliday junction resolvase RusA-like endonuclease
VRLRFVVPGPPVPKARARTTTSGGVVRTYTPHKTAAYEKHVGLHALAARQAARSWAPLDGKARFGIAINIYRSIDRGDIDNHEKAILDACNGVLWNDDAQIRRRGEGGIYDCPKGQERAEVEVWVI